MAHPMEVRIKVCEEFNRINLPRRPLTRWLLGPFLTHLLTATRKSPVASTPACTTSSQYINAQ